MNSGDLEIKQLGLSLPPELKHRAKRITSLLGHELTRIPVHQTRQIPRMDLKPLKVTPTDSDRKIAGTIARAIGKAIENTSFIRE